MEDRRTGLRATIDALGPGVVFAGHRLEDRLGEGGMGVVFRARHLRLGRTVALKVIAPQWGSDPTFRELFEREARMAASVDHPHVIDVYDFGEVDGRLYLSMRFVEGVDLNALVRTLAGLPLLERRMSSRRRLRVWMLLTGRGWSTEMSSRTTSSWPSATGAITST